LVWKNYLPLFVPKYY